MLSERYLSLYTVSSVQEGYSMNRLTSPRKSDESRRSLNILNVPDRYKLWCFALALGSSGPLPTLQMRIPQEGVWTTPDRTNNVIGSTIQQQYKYKRR